MKQSRLTKRPSLTHPLHSFVVGQNSFVLRQQKSEVEGDGDLDSEYFESQSLGDSDKDGKDS